MTMLLSKYRDGYISPFDRLVDEAFGTVFGDISYAGKNSFPKVDVVEYKDKLVLEADVAGLSKEDVSVDLEGDVLTIRGGKRTKPENAEERKYVYREIKRSSFLRTFVVGDNIDKKAIKADLRDGTLTVELPRVKEEEKQPTRIKLL